MTFRDLFFLLPLTSMSAAFGCDCKPTLSVEEALMSSELVVSGTIIQVHYKKELDQTVGYLDSLGQRNERRFFGPIHVNEYLILVNGDFKGASVGDTVIVRTALD